jgi:DNA-binding transcriptional ArsR family regulator
MSEPRAISSVTLDVTALKALAHPDRLRLLGRLRLEGPATATALGRRLGLNSGAASYHLRQLAAHGFIEPAAELGNRRDRWWRAAHESTISETAGLSGDDLEAGLAFGQAIIATHTLMMRRAHAAYRDLPVAWREASTASDFTMAIGADAAKALTGRLMALLWEAKAAAPPTGTPDPPGTRPFTVLLHAFPYPGLDPVDGEGK